MKLRTEKARKQLFGSFGLFSQGHSFQGMALFSNHCKAA
jgi:hypothetical protein